CSSDLCNCCRKVASSYGSKVALPFPEMTSLISAPSAPHRPHVDRGTTCRWSSALPSSQLTPASPSHPGATYQATSLEFHRACFRQTSTALENQKSPLSSQPTDGWCTRSQIQHLHGTTSVPCAQTRKPLAIA